MTGAEEDQRQRPTRRLVTNVLLAVTIWLFSATEEAAQASRPSTLGECAATPTPACVLALAIGTAEEIEDAYERSRRFRAHCRSAKRGGRSDGSGPKPVSGNNCCHLKQRYCRSSQTGARARAFIDIARTQIAIGDKTKARQTLSRTLAESDGIKVPRHRADVLRDISVAQRLAGDEDEARQTPVAGADGDRPNRERRF